MHRRRVLQVGAAIATLPLTGCGAGAPEVDHAPPGGPGVENKTPGGDLDAGTTAGNDDAGAAGAGDAGAAPVQEAPKVVYARVIVRFGKNHGHALAVPIADVQAGTEKTYPLTGSTHPHKVTFTPEQMLSLLGGKIVRTTTTTDKGHTHRVVVRCAPEVDPPEWVAACRVEFSGKDEHELIVSAVDRAAKVEKTYDIQGTAGHSHEVKITAEGFEKLAKKEALSLKASNAADDGHTHVVVVYPEPPKKA